LTVAIWVMALIAMLAVAGLFGVRRFHGALRRGLIVEPLDKDVARNLFNDIAPSGIAHHWSTDGGKRHLFADAEVTWLGIMIATDRDPISRVFSIDALEARTVPAAGANVDLGWSPLRLQLNSKTASTELLHLIARNSEEAALRRTAAGTQARADA